MHARVGGAGDRLWQLFPAIIDGPIQSLHRNNDDRLDRAQFQPDFLSGGNKRWRYFRENLFVLKFLNFSSSNLPQR